MTPQSVESDKPDTPRTPTFALNKEAETSKGEQSTPGDNESSPSPKQVSQSAQQQQHQYPEHRASIASAPPCTARSGSISTITGVRSIMKCACFRKNIANQINESPFSNLPLYEIARFLRDNGVLY